MQKDNMGEVIAKVEFADEVLRLAKEKGLRVVRRARRKRKPKGTTTKLTKYAAKKPKKSAKKGNSKDKEHPLAATE